MMQATAGCINPLASAQILLSASRCRGVTNVAVVGAAAAVVVAVAVAVVAASLSANKGES